MKAKTKMSTEELTMFLSNNTQIDDITIIDYESNMSKYDVLEFIQSGYTTNTWQCTTPDNNKLIIQSI